MASVYETESRSAQCLARILVVGGSYGGLAAALNLLDLCQGKASRFTLGEIDYKASEPARAIKVQITIVDERDGFYHLIGSPLALASAPYANNAWVAFKDIPALQRPGLSCVQGSVTRVSFKNKIAAISDHKTGKQYDQAYDYLVVGSGLRRVWPVVPQSLHRSDYLREVHHHIQAVKDAKESVVVIGGGAVGVEMAAELKLVEPTQTVILVHSRAKLLSSEPLPDEFKDETLSLLKDTGTNVILGRRVIDSSPVHDDSSAPITKLTLSDGSHIMAGHVISAISDSTPSRSYLPDKVLDARGYVKIGPSLQFASNIPNAESHYAVGDIAAWSGIKRCGAAMAMGFNAATNIHQQLLEKIVGKKPDFVKFPDVPPMIGLAVGKKAVSYSPSQGVESGEKVMEMFFGDDLGFTICWNYLKLSQ